MRPVNKGKAPEQKFKKYQEAEPYLEKQIGAYCSFCEFPVKHVPEVEHKEAKARGGVELNWDNLLLSCKYCNTRKSIIVGNGDRKKYLWPDEDDTFHVFSYASDIPKLNEEYLKGQNEGIRTKAENLFHLVKLNHVPLSPKEKDRRYLQRNEARNCAIESKRGWDQVKESADREIYLVQIKMLACAVGFFSTWMSVFKDDKVVKNVLIAAFKGTRVDYGFD